MIEQARAIDFYDQPVEARPHLRLAASNGELIGSREAQVSESTRYKGGVVLERLAREADATTQLAEIVDGVMLTEFELSLVGEDLFDDHGRSLDKITSDALEKAETQARANPNYEYEARRRRLNRKEFELGVEMAKGVGPNTRIVISDFPEELMDADEDFMGYNVTRQQAMIQIWTRLPNGKVLLQTQSLDGSNRQGLEAIAEKFNHRLQPGEALGQHVEADLSEQEQPDVVDLVVQTYDAEMQDQFGGVYYAGRRPADYRNTYIFVCQQKDILDTWVEADEKNILTKDLMYKLAATTQERFDKNQKVQPVPESTKKLLSAEVVYINPAVGSYERPAEFWREVNAAGLRARSEGKTFSACGGTLKVEKDGEISLADGLDSAFGEKNGETSWHGGKIHKNTKCVSCEEVKAEVGACKICKDCVDHPKKNLRTVQNKLKDPKKAKINKEPAKVLSFEDGRKKREARLAAGKI